MAAEHVHTGGAECANCGKTHKAHPVSLEDLMNLIKLAVAKASEKLLAGAGRKDSPYDTIEFTDMENLIFSFLASYHADPVVGADQLYGLIAEVGSDGTIGATMRSKLLFFSVLRMQEKKSYIEERENILAGLENRAPRNILEVMLGEDPLEKIEKLYKEERAVNEAPSNS